MNGKHLVKCFGLLVMHLSLLKKKSSLLLKLVMHYQSSFLTEIILIQGGGEKTAVRIKKVVYEVALQLLSFFHFSSSFSSVFQKWTDKSLG